MKDWEKYEEQIFEKLSDEFPDSNILKNQKITGKYSNRSRQIDILVKSESIGRNLLIAVDCKMFNKKIDIKTVESFIGFTEDIGAHVGILITNKGYSKSALNRVKNYHRDIQLDIIEFEYIDDYHFSWDDCYLCKDEYDIPRGRIIWNEPFGFIDDGALTIIDNGKCSYCGEIHAKCQGCGMTLEFDSNSTDEIHECYCENIFSIKSEYIGRGMYENQIIIRKKINNEDDDNFEVNDPNQIKLFE
ncbi:restriction endonuclease [Flavobacterium tyrosinilyticum]|uniref:restriction endonuclease n=1 Tax=Flavobacterium tyrosinilyticum TaxID=1658740 RepID=UPI00202EFB75|nr:restriction endonuclease [Flavobacterium tyrosinilyticum]MCM0665105.1 restriction endonuclease [Flavobacterium tyrosinilyticum]